MKVLVKKEHGKLVPTDEYSEEMISKMTNTVYACEIKKERNMLFHRKFFAMIKLFFDNQEIFLNIDHFRAEMIKSAGYHESYINHKKVKVYVPKSISFASMDQHEFEKLYNSVFASCLKNLNLESSRAEFLNELEKFVE